MATLENWKFLSSKRADVNQKILDRGKVNTGEVGFGETRARMGDYFAEEMELLGGNLEEILGQGGLGIVPVTLDSPTLEPCEPCEEEKAIEDWSFVPAEDTKEAGMGQYSFMVPVKPLNPSQDKLKMLSPEDMPEPPPPAEVRRVLQNRMRELGRTLMISSGKSPRQQMMAIQSVLEGLLDQLEDLSDQPGREALRRRILLQVRPRVMRF